MSIRHLVRKLDDDAIDRALLGIKRAKRTGPSEHHPRPAETYRGPRRNTARWFAPLFKRLEGSNWRTEFDAQSHVKIRPHVARGWDYSKGKRPRVQTLQRPADEGGGVVVPVA